MTGGHLKELRDLEAGGGDINLLVRVCELQGKGLLKTGEL
jgi:hypothetical protein